MHVFAGRVKIVSHSSCRTSTILIFFCSLLSIQIIWAKLLFLQSFCSLFQSSPEKVQFVISRKSRPQTPDIIRSTSATLGNFSIEESQWAMCKKCEELLISINKVTRFTVNILEFQTCGCIRISCSTQLSMTFKLLIETKMLENIMHFSCFQTLSCIYYANKW